MSNRNELIEKARKLSAAATPGPWNYNAGDVLANDGQMIAPDIYRGLASMYDGKFIAESRTLLPALVDLAESEARRAAENAQANQVACAGWDRAKSDLARLTERLRVMQHGETEALKMMGAEKRRADELAAQLETERAEFAEFRLRLLRALKPVGIESGLLDIELAAVRTQELAAAKAEAAQTKQELAALRDLAETLAKGISAYRWKSESVAAAWENEYGHTVPR